MVYSCFRLVHIGLLLFPPDSHWFTPVSAWFTLVYSCFRLVHIGLLLFQPGSHWFTPVYDWFTLAYSCFRLVHIGLLLFPTGSHWFTPVSNWFTLVYSLSPTGSHWFTPFLRLVHIGLLPVSDWFKLVYSLSPTGSHWFNPCLRLVDGFYSCFRPVYAVNSCFFYKFTALFFCVLDRSMASDGWWRAVACGFSHLYHEINAPRAIDGNSYDKSCSDGSRREVTSLISFRFI